MSGQPNRRLALAELTMLSSRRAAELADCDRSTLQRGLKKAKIEPVGKRGRTLFYATADVLAWLASGLKANAPAAQATTVQRAHRAAAPNELALARLARLRGGKR